MTKGSTDCERGMEIKKIMSFLLLYPGNTDKFFVTNGDTIGQNVNVIF